MTRLLLYLCSLITLVASECFLTNGDKGSLWSACDCQAISIDVLKVECRHVPWITVPTVPPVEKIKFHLTSLSIVDSRLMYLSYDAFRLQSIQMLDLSNNMIDSINYHAFRGLENRLFQLIFDGNSLTRIPSAPIENLHQLRYLHLKNNKIDLIEANTFKDSGLTNLRFLYLDNNLIKMIPRNVFSNLNLQVLTLNGNQIQQIDGNTLPPSLWHLALKGNYLDSIPYTALATTKNLRLLDLESNNVSRLESYAQLKFEENVTINLCNNRIVNIPAAAFSSFVNMDHLDLSYNMMSSVDSNFLHGVKTLKSLDMSHNRLSFLGPKIFNGVADSLQRLLVDKNELLEINDFLQPLNALQHLNVMSNKLAQLTIDPQAMWKNALQELILSHNYVSKVSLDTMEQLPRLKILDLSKNYIDNLSSLKSSIRKSNGLTGIVKLNLAGNLLKSLDDPTAFLHMSSLAYLDLSHNSIAQISPNFFNSLSGLESLSLKWNRLKSIPVNALKRLVKLRHLILDGNEIRTLFTESLDQAQHLERISLAHNKIHAIMQNSIQPEHFRSIRSINCAYNAMQFVGPKSFRNLKRLESIELQGNNLAELHMYTFVNLTNVRRIDLSQNAIGYISEAAFVNLPNLNYLSLRQNNLSSLLGVSFVHVVHLEHLDLARNGFETFDSNFLKHLNAPSHLDLSENCLFSLKLDNWAKSLVCLKASRNKLQFVDERTFALMEKLQFLDLSNNNIVHVHPNAWRRAFNLIQVQLNRNLLVRLKSQVFHGPRLVHNLDLSNNHLSRLDAGAFGRDNVLNLNLKSNDLKEVPSTALFNLSGSLSVLDLSSNKIEDIRSEMFNDMKNLSKLLLNANEIRRISAMAFKGLHKLQSLDLSSNPIDEWNPNAFQEVSQSLINVNLANVGLYSVPNFNGRPLRELNLSKNHLNYISFDDGLNVKKLESLDVSFNRIGKFEKSLLEKLGNVRKLNISHNNLEELDEAFFDSFPKLQLLSCHHMPHLRTIKSQAFGSLKHLQSLELYNVGPVQEPTNVEGVLQFTAPLRNLVIEINNKEISDQFNNFDTRLLRELRIDASGVHTVDKRAFYNFRGYHVHLALYNSKIAYLSPQVFSALSHVQRLELDLSNNRLSTLNPFMKFPVPGINHRGTVLVDVNLANNPLHCDERLQWIGAWLVYLRGAYEPEEFQRHLKKWNAILCWTPKEKSHYSLVDVYYYHNLSSRSDGSSILPTSWLNVALGYLIVRANLVWWF